LRGGFYWLGAVLPVLCAEVLRGKFLRHPGTKDWKEFDSKPDDCLVSLFRLERKATKGQVAQLVEQRTENPRVGGSIPSLAIQFISCGCSIYRASKGALLFFRRRSYLTS
jgi:hypothetical protein